MSIFNQLFNMEKPFQRMNIAGGQTQGFVTAPSSSGSSYPLPGPQRRQPGGTDYARKYQQREEEEEEKIEKKLTEANYLLNVDDLTSMGTVANVNELEREELIQVYDNYVFDRQKRVEGTKLAVFDHEESILNIIRTYRTCVIKGNTGCGKTTQIPQMILDSHVKAKKHCNIVVTQPRRIAAISVAKRVSEERGWPIQTIVGYQVGLEKATSADTRLTYCTTGVLLQKLIVSKHLNDYTHIILDEVHERDQETDFLMLVVRKLQRLKSPNVKVILMSATINTSSFTKYFCTSSGDEAPVLEVGSKSNYPVVVFYLDDLETKLGPYAEIIESRPKIDETSYKYVVKLIEAFDLLDDRELKKKGSVLVFLPGMHEIEMLFEELEKTQLVLGKQLWLICPLHSTITADEQLKAFKPPPPGFRKIILSTNIAESSITVADIKYVIDFCLTKIMQADPETSLSSLHLAWASKNQCVQRAGRVGRVMEGRVYRMVPKEFYNYYMQDEASPEILRCPLEVVVLRSKQLEMGEPIEVLSLAMDPPDLARLEQTILLLKEVGALLMTVDGEYHPMDGDMTFLGQVMSALPLDIKLAKLILLGHIFSVLEETIIMGCAMTVKSMFSKPFKKDLEAYISKLTWADSTCSDSIACLNAYKLWRLTKTSGKFDISAGGGSRGWGRRFFIQLNAMNEIARLQDEVTRRLKMFNIEEVRGRNRVKWDSFMKPLIMKIVIAGAFYPHYFVRSQYGGQINESEAVKILGGRDPYSTIYLTNFPPNQPGPLYANSIKEHFKDCGIAARNVKVSFDSSSKVYIEFKGSQVDNNFDGPDDNKLSSSIPGKVSTAVYRALKMRHYTSSSINILVLPPEEAKRQISKIEAFKASKQNMQEKTAVVKNNILPSLNTSAIVIKIVHVNHVGNFYAIHADHYSKMEKFVTILNKGDVIRPLKGRPQVNKLYAVPFVDSDRNTLYYRGLVVELEANVAKVCFVDYGNIETISATSLRSFVPISHIQSQHEIEVVNLETEPYLAFNCTLARIQPSSLKDHRVLWSEEANNVFKMYCCDRDVSALVYSVVDNVVALELYMPDRTSYKRRGREDDIRNMITINEYLVSTKVAEWNEESYISKVDHELRKSCQSSFSYDDTKMSQSFSSEVHVEDNSEMPQLNKQQCRKPVRLRGPYSPLEMTTYSSVHSNMKKVVAIEQDSVNSVLLDTHPHDPHERMLVAGSVGQSASGDRLILRYTTLLPNIHGLSALISLLFSPYCEFRVNKNRTRLTGALCGLGCDSYKESYFPENDLEVVFDTSFTLDDVIEVNKLRFWMSVFLSGIEPAPNPTEFSFQETLAHQLKVEKLILSLLKLLGNQETERPEASGQAYQWGLVDESLLISPVQGGEISDDPIWLVYRLLYGVEMVEPEDSQPDKRFVKNILELKDIAAGRTKIRGATCDLCQISFDNVRSLKLHLQSTQHTELATKYHLNDIEEECHVSDVDEKYHLNDIDKKK